MDDDKTNRQQDITKTTPSTRDDTKRLVHSWTRVPPSRKGFGYWFWETWEIWENPDDRTLRWYNRRG